MSSRTRRFCAGCPSGSEARRREPSSGTPSTRTTRITPKPRVGWTPPSWGTETVGFARVVPLVRRVITRSAAFARALRHRGGCRARSLARSATPRDRRANTSPPRPGLLQPVVTAGNLERRPSRRARTRARRDSRLVRLRLRRFGTVRWTNARTAGSQGRAGSDPSRSPNRCARLDPCSDQPSPKGSRHASRPWRAASTWYRAEWAGS